MLFVARRTAFPTPAEIGGLWARTNGVQSSAANRNRERCLIAMNLRALGSVRFGCRDLGPALTTYVRIHRNASTQLWNVAAFCDGRPSLRGASWRRAPQKCRCPEREGIRCTTRESA